MKKCTSFVLLMLCQITFINAQEKQFKNQGEYEDYQAVQFFKKEYSRQSYDKFQGKISIENKSAILFENKLYQEISLKNM